jgi:hypothetical protein
MGLVRALARGLELACSKCLYIVSTTNKSLNWH